MKKNDFRKAAQHFNAKYGDDYYNASKTFDFGWSCLPRIIQYSDLPSDAKICMAVMIDLKHNNTLPNPQLYYPSQKRIAFLSGLSVPSVSRALNKLEDARLIGKMRLGQGKQNIYCLLNPPEEFVLNAVKHRGIIELIRQDKLDWTDIDEKGEVIIEDENERCDAQTLINTLICKYANQEYQICKSIIPNQGVRNSPGSTPTLRIDDSELSSDELSSVESSSGNGFSENSSSSHCNKTDDDDDNDIKQKEDNQQHPVVESSTGPLEINDNYFTSIEEKLSKLSIRQVLSPVESRKISEMKLAGIPLELVLKTIDEVVENKKRSNDTRKIKSFNYFVDAIREKFNAAPKPYDMAGAKQRQDELLQQAKEAGI